ncbi:MULTISPECIES: hypothetical protein [Brevibacillus]|jgi:hypothetical protein|uniref:Uncharacterized protein n=1 Tax=Brevibacillus parabrevis TaxID=54914 RepID=A0A4Y3PAR1_BREPA|nr:MULTISPECIES: hypothetical protein [Brevibacillus]MDH6348188.1 hypothetical protein [Brevibacillus sp. 1238]MDR5000313.1 hypothetical protein [Brevibacillus parabrevis]UED70274.1 hypothetical protein HP435_06495 [Brevibacillus sp. HD3.3A]GEB30547.1 hypothetical protein BPA01_01270 [Brevibacillus parabrevis]
MKKISSLVIAFALVSSLVVTPSGMAAEKNFNIRTVGHLESITSETEYNEATGEEITTEKHGVDVKGMFNVNEKLFSAKIKNLEQGISYNLIGELDKVLSEDQAYYFIGKDSNNDLIQFEAIVEKVSDNDYKSTINIYEYLENNEEPINANTFIFDGNSSEIKKYRIETERKPIVLSLSNNALKSFSEEDSYYSDLQGGSGEGYRYLIQGPETTHIDAGNNYAFRWGTKIKDIETKLKKEGIDYTGYHDIVDFRTRVYTNAPLVFNTVEPISNSTTEFQIPMYLGQYVGTQFITVRAHDVTITGSGTDNLLYKLTWNSAYSPSGYLDERKFDVNPKSAPGFVVKYFMDTPSSISTGSKKVNFNGYFKYRSKYNSYSLLLNYYTEITHSDYYTIKIIK